VELHGLIWLDEIVDKLAWKHNVVRAEVVEVLDSKPHIRFIEKGHRDGENVYAAFGRTAAGRYLIIFYVLKLDGMGLILSARDMSPKERKYYENR